MTSKLQPILTAVALILAMGFWITYCHDPQVRKAALQGQQDQTDNRTIARMAFESFAQESTFQRERDSTAKVIAKLRRRVIPRDSILIHDTLQVVFQLDARDSVIDALSAQHVQDSLHILFWRGQAIVYRDSLVPALVLARDNWKRQAQSGVFTKVVRAVPYLAAGLVIGRLLK